MNSMNFKVLIGLMVPFVGTSLGAMMVFFMKNELNQKVKRALTAFAAGVMISASFWSLLIPAVNQASETMGKMAVIPTGIGFCLGMAFLLLIDIITPHMHLNQTQEGPKRNFKKNTMLVLAVVIHNIPEGMAAGVVFAGWLQGNALVSFSGALSLAIGLAIQNFPEGAIISMPLHANGESKGKAFFRGVLSGAVEPIAGFLTIVLASLVIPMMPVMLSFAAGAMIYVVIEELIPDMSEGKHSNLVTIAFILGFVGMMILDITLG